MLQAMGNSLNAAKSEHSGSPFNRVRGSDQVVYPLGSWHGVLQVLQAFFDDLEVFCGFFEKVPDDAL
jgi:hypothetical protein